MRERLRAEGEIRGLSKRRQQEQDEQHLSREGRIYAYNGLMDETEAASPERVRLYFYIAQIVAGVLFLAWVFFFRNREQPSGFRTREADQSRKPADRRKPGEVDPLAEAKIRKNEPLRLSGIRIDAPAHEILGVASHASPQEIQKAYRELMKRYHPDKVGPPGSRQWKDAQQIAEAINRAKEHLLKNRK